MITIDKDSIEAVGKIVNKGLRKYKGKIEVESMRNGDGWDKYLKKASENLSTYVSILDGKTRNIYDTYQCTGLTNGEIEYNCSIRDLINLNKDIIITGIGGIGKTTMMKHLFLDAIKEKLTPIYIELRQVNDIDVNNLSIIDIIYLNIERYGFNISKESFVKDFRNGKYVILFDAYDEIKNQKIKFINDEIKKLSNQCDKNVYIVTSRPNDEFDSWGNFLKLNSIPLNKEQAISLVKKLNYGEYCKNDSFCLELKNSLFEKYEDFASNPLLLTIMLMTYHYNAYIPQKINEFYEEIFWTLFRRHDKRKGNDYIREYKSKLDYQEFKEIFSHFCVNTFLKQKISFNESNLIDELYESINKLNLENNCNAEDFKYDLEHSVCMVIKEGNNYNFIHRTFQEYFAAYYIAKILKPKEQERIVANIMKQQNIFSLKNFLIILNSISEERFKSCVLYNNLCELKKYKNNENIDEVRILKDTYPYISYEINSLSYEVKDYRMHSILYLYIFVYGNEKIKIKGVNDIMYYFIKHYGKEKNKTLYVDDFFNVDMKEAYMNYYGLEKNTLKDMFKIIYEIENSNIEDNSIDDII